MKSFNLQNLLQPIARDNGFRMDDYWTWDGSIIKAEDGRWHMFASRWPKKYAMHPGWLVASEIVRASSDTPEGPYTFEEVVLAPRDKSFFDGRMTHNPSIRKVGDTYLLFYIGVTYTVDLPADPTQIGHETIKGTDRWIREIWQRKRIGLATSQSINGPWTRCDEPILLPRRGKWDRGTTSNPSPFVMSDGSIYLAYKSSYCTKGTDLAPFNIGIARADSWDAPFVRVTDDPCFQMPPGEHFVEDPFLWHADGEFHIIMKDLTGNLCGEKGCGIYAHSKNAIDWEWGDPIIAYTRDVAWQDGAEHVGQIERPQLVFEDGAMAYFTAASAYSEGDLQGVTDSWVSVFPLKQG